MSTELKCSNQRYTQIRHRMCTHSMMHTHLYTMLLHIYYTWKIPHAILRFNSVLIRMMNVRNKDAYTKHKTTDARLTLSMSILLAKYVWDCLEESLNRQRKRDGQILYVLFIQKWTRFILYKMFIKMLSNAYTWNIHSRLFSCVFSFFRALCQFRNMKKEFCGWLNRVSFVENKNKN